MRAQTGALAHVAARAGCVASAAYRASDSQTLKKQQAQHTLHGLHADWIQDAQRAHTLPPACDDYRWAMTGVHGQCAS